MRECQEEPEAPGCASLSRSDFPEELTSNYFPFFNFRSISRTVPLSTLLGIAMLFASLVVAAAFMGRRSHHSSS